MPFIKKIEFWTSIIALLAAIFGLSKINSIETKFNTEIVNIKTSITNISRSETHIGTQVTATGSGRGDVTGLSIGR
ncbi:MAG: hypothetical protein PHT32_00490 [Candidatus Omnitrophica bacterium]|nr:hypothetical protein [Candidatus Omnitrophota bacterium]